jgi:hypothetical protein
MNISVLKGQKILLIDAAGATVSAISLLIPYSFEALFGMPQSVVRIFISIAIICAIYSATVYFTGIKNWRPYLTIIALINIGYCIFTAYHVVRNLDTITVYGHLYFAAEILIILALSFFELRAGRRAQG